jgi:hypothetical protein
MAIGLLLVLGQNPPEIAYWKRANGGLPATPSGAGHAM